MVAKYINNNNNNNNNNDFYFFFVLSNFCARIYTRALLILVWLSCFSFYNFAICSDRELRDEASGIPLLYGTFSIIWGFVFSLIFFRCGWSNAKEGTTVFEAFREYQRERKQHVLETAERKKVEKQMSKMDDESNSKIKIVDNKTDDNYANESDLTLDIEKGETVDSIISNRAKDTTVKVGLARMTSNRNCNNTQEVKPVEWCEYVLFVYIYRSVTSNICNHFFYAWMHSLWMTREFLNHQLLL